MADGAARWTHGHRATTYGSTVVTDLVRDEADECRWRTLLTHEAVHVSQWAWAGGGFLFVVAYLEDWAWHGYRYSRTMWLERPAYEAGDRAKADC